MSNKYKILELLKQNELTIKEISDKSEFNENEVRVYIHRLKEDGLIREIGKKNRYIIYVAIEKEETNFDAEILKKMIPEFIKKGIEIDLDNNEIERVRELYGEI